MKIEAWGAAEHAARLADIVEVKAGNMTLEKAQSNARSRQRASGLTPSQVSSLVAAHCRELRRAETLIGSGPILADATPKDPS